MAAPVLRWVIALLVASLAMGLALAHAAYAGERRDPPAGGSGNAPPAVDINLQQ